MYFVVTETNNKKSPLVLSRWGFLSEYFLRLLWTGKYVHPVYYYIIFTGKNLKLKYDGGILVKNTKNTMKITKFRRSSNHCFIKLKTPKAHYWLVEIIIWKTRIYFSLSSFGKRIFFRLFSFIVLIFYFIQFILFRLSN